MLSHVYAMFFWGETLTHTNTNLKAYGRSGVPSHTCECYSFFFFASGRRQAVCSNVGRQAHHKRKRRPQKPLIWTYRQALDVVDVRVLVFFGTSAVAQSLHKPMKFP